MFIINPIWFYLISIFSGIKLLGMLIFAISLVLSVPFVIGWLENFDSEELINVLKKNTIIGLIGVILMIFIPSEETCKEMMVASLLTKENIESIGTNGKEMIDYIFEKIEEINENLDKSE